jgi:5,10-methylenetetrahydromethanopterin reductase
VRLGIEFVPYSRIDTLTELARRAEGAGFEYIWVSDHYHNRYVHSVLVHLAQATNKIKLGPGVTNPYLVHPSVTAAAVATLDEISGGRAVLGISAGDPFFLATVGVRHHRPIVTVREAIEIIQRLLSGERVNYSGDIFTCHGANLRFKPPSTIPVYIGGRKRHMLELAGSVASGALINASHPEDLKECIKYVRKGARKTKRKPKELDLVAYMVTSIDEDEKKARSRARTVVSFVAASAPPAALERHGIPLSDVEKICEFLRAGNIQKARSTVTQPMIDAFSVSGPPDKLASHVEKLSKLGVTQIVAGSPIGPSPMKAIDPIANMLRSLNRS